MRESCRDEMRSHRGTAEARGTRRQHGHSSRTLAVATQVNYGRPSVRRSGPSGFPVTVSLRRLRLFSPRRSLFICARDGHFADGSRRSVAMQRTRHIIALQRRPGRPSDERRQIAAGTCWINLLSISSVASPRCSRSRIVVQTIKHRHQSSSLPRSLTSPASNPNSGVKLLVGPHRRFVSP